MRGAGGGKGEREGRCRDPERSRDQRARTPLLLIGVAAAENRVTASILAAPANSDCGLRSSAVRLCMFRPKERELERGWPGRLDGDRVIQLAAQTLQAFFTGGAKAREHAEYPLDEVQLLAPVLHPPSVRHFDAMVGGDTPTFHFGNPASIYGPDDPVPYPEGASGIVFELELAAMIGADAQIGGFTIMNDWYAPDLEPSKHRDFATSLGPVVVTPDELGEAPEAVVRVNGVEQSRADIVALRFGWPEMIERASLNTRLFPGDVLGSGALLRGDGRPLQPGDRVELEVEGIGVLANSVLRGASS